MRTLFKIAFLSCCVFITAFTLPLTTPISEQLLSKDQAVAVIRKVYDASNTVRTELRIDTTLYAQCDTCVSSLQNAIQLKRTLTDSLTVQNSILYKNWLESIALNDSLLKINNIVRTQILKSKFTVKHLAKLE